MSAEQLANDRMRQIRRSLTDELRDEHLLPEDAGDVHSNMFTLVLFSSSLLWTYEERAD